MLKQAEQFQYIDISENAGLTPNTLVKGLDEALQRFFMVLSTPKGARYKRPLFGCNIYRYLFNPFDEETADNIKDEIIDCTQDEDNHIKDIKPYVQVQLDRATSSYYVTMRLEVLGRGTTPSINFSLRKL